MKKTTQLSFILLLCLIISSCVPESNKSGKRKTDGASAPTTDSTSTNTDSTSFGGEIHWYNSQDIPGTITVNSNIQTVIYIRGEAIHKYLNQNSNHTKKYCMVSSFNQLDPTAKNLYKVRAVPLSISNFQTKSVERLLRIDLSTSDVNSQDCGGRVPGATVTGDSFEPANVCLGCNGIISASKVQIFETLGGINDLVEIPTSQLDTSSLGFRIDIQSNYQGPGSSCTDSECTAKNFDCCLEGQCVKDGAQKSNPDANDLAQALADVANNPQNFINWPSVYFICSNVPRPQPTPTPLPDAKATADAEFAQKQSEYNCLTLGHIDQASRSFVNCAANTSIGYQETRRAVWTRCGCSHTYDPIDTSNPDDSDGPDPYCPDYTLEPLLDSSQKTVDYICKVPLPDVEPTPVQKLDVPVSGKRAPHRFYDSDGASHDDLSVVKATYESSLSTNPATVKPMQEGVEFSYLDESGKTSPMSGSFNMNSITGQMAVELNRALPALMLPVEYDQTYVITSKSGYYTPCPTCSSDFWFSTFKPYPNSDASKPGQGLVAVGATTSRMQDNYNLSLGNYEDTLFGRACWLPPTMIPFSHKPILNPSDSNDPSLQRQARLNTQAALYINGYQRDWFGFNKGALIGSFDGVNWFAVGKGRRVTATSKKLFLAINAPFADLAENTDTIVHVATDLGGNTVADYDYNPNLAYNDKAQTGAGSCQMYHQCEVDSDCVTKLGWEYTCSDITEYKTYLPKFDPDAKEAANDELADITFSKLITGGITGANNKRCVYRGAGAPCKQSYNSGGLTDNTKELFRCAPNFYCAGLGSNNFNQEVARTPAKVNLIDIGQDADILGRPLSYLGGTGSGTLTQEIIDNLTYNAALYFGKDTTSVHAQDFGICRPGKNLASNDWEVQHSSKDAGLRTDYISQIGSCDSSATGDTKIRSCPTFDSDGNYTFPNSDFSDTRIQNMCGLESQKEIAAPLYESSFKNIEAGILSSLANLMAPNFKVPVDACLRRAGAVCFSDLDCSPGALHGKDALLQDRFSFGNTVAEFNYWKETLICGQAARKPSSSLDDMLAYDMTKNRCCREIGSDLTMFTAGTDVTLNPGITNSESLDPNTFAGHDGKAVGRYSRYNVVDGIQNRTSMLASQTPYAQAPRVEKGVQTPVAASAPIAYQWKAINDSGKRTCCGGGFVRKFEDNINNWARSDRLTINPVAFSCLNYNTTLPFESPASVDPDNYSLGYSRLCLSPADNNGCVQKAISQAPGFQIQNPVGLTVGTATLNTTPDEDPTNNNQVTIINNLSTETPYMPIPYPNPTPMSGTKGPFSFIADPDFLYAASFYIPSYISVTQADYWSNINSVTINYFKDGNNIRNTAATQLVECPTRSATLGNPRDDFGGALEVACIDTDQSGTYMVMHVVADPDFDNDGNTDWDYAGISINFDQQNSAGHTPAPTSLPLTAGNDLYYLNKLARFELVGIPQIVYEPIYCNDQRDKLVEDIFDISSQTRAGFEDTSVSFQYDDSVNGRRLTEFQDSNLLSDASNPNQHVVQMDKLNFKPIFKANEFMCCLELGSETADSSSCCSGFSKTDSTTSKNTCMLPKGANINVYFNRFISGDGVGDEQPGGGLVDDDFVPETGEPKLRDATYKKLSALGGTYCENNKVRRGAAFGHFYAEPNNNSYVQEGSLEDSRYYSIIDSSKDRDDDKNTGMSYFIGGYRWDHHMYCD